MGFHIMWHGNAWSMNHVTFSPPHVFFSGLWCFLNKMCMPHAPGPMTERAYIARSLAASKGYRNFHRIANPW